MSMGGERHATEGERRRMPRYYLAVPVDIWMDDRREREPYRGSLNNLSGVGVGLTLGQPLKTNQKVTLRFPLYSAEETGPPEFLSARVIWQRGDFTGLEFDPPLAGTRGGVVFQQIAGEGREAVDPLPRAGSSAVQKAPELVAHLGALRISSSPQGAVFADRAEQDAAPHTPAEERDMANVEIAWADDAAVHEPMLEEKAATINDLPTTPQRDAARVQALATHYQVPESSITALQTQGKGWGEIILSLAMAAHLSGISKTSLTMEQALAKIEQLRPSKVGLRQIAKDLGFMLGDVVREVNKGEKVVRTADRARRSARRGR